MRSPTHEITAPSAGLTSSRRTSATCPSRHDAALLDAASPRLYHYTIIIE